MGPFPDIPRLAMKLTGADGITLVSRVQGFSIDDAGLSDEPLMAMLQQQELSAGPVPGLGCHVAPCESAAQGWPLRREEWSVTRSCTDRQEARGNTY